MDFQEAVQWLDSRPTPASWRLERMQLLADATGVDYSRIKFAHVTGSNGKGSVCAFLDSMLRAQGFKTGFYSSPHLVSITERFRLDNEKISEEEFAGLAEWVKPFAEACEASHFETLTMMALKFYADSGAEWVVWEVGMGGRLDATNIVTPAVSVVTGVSIEHAEHLGNTIEAIAREKAGIIKSCAPVVCACDGEALQVMQEKAKEQNTRVVSVEPPSSVACSRDGTAFAWRASTWQTHLLGDFQALNACTALEAALIIGLSEEAMRAGLADARWPARMDLIGDVLVDGCHNPDGARVFAESVNEIFPGEKRLVVGVLADKDCAGVARELAKITGVVECLAVQPDNPRALASEKWAAALCAAGLPARASSLDEALAGKGFTVVCGSLYLAGEALKKLNCVV
ncbi:MAG: folylpolyglutamate synthase/dihydrofolate synthase family protein [Candidatus Micrarchaeia archaeon]